MTLLLRVRKLRRPLTAAAVLVAGSVALGAWLGWPNICTLARLAAGSELSAADFAVGSRALRLAQVDGSNALAAVISQRMAGDHDVVVGLGWQELPAPEKLLRPQYSELTVRRDCAGGELEVFAHRADMQYTFVQGKFRTALRGWEDNAGRPALRVLDDEDTREQMLTAFPGLVAPCPASPGTNEAFSSALDIVGEPQALRHWLQEPGDKPKPDGQRWLPGATRFFATHASQQAVLQWDFGLDTVAAQGAFDALETKLQQLQPPSATRYAGHSAQLRRQVMRSFEGDRAVVTELTLGEMSRVRMAWGKAPRLRDELLPPAVLDLPPAADAVPPAATTRPTPPASPFTAAAKPVRHGPLHSPFLSRLLFIPWLLQQRSAN